MRLGWRRDLDGGMAQGEAAVIGSDGALMIGAMLSGKGEDVACRIGTGNDEMTGKIDTELLSVVEGDMMRTGCGGTSVAGDMGQSEA